MQPYTQDEIKGILKAAKDAHLEIIPLVQTFGHLEWILKLPEFAHLRENPNIPQVICFGSEEGWKLITELIDIVANAHKPFGLPFFHIGADEAFQLGLCEDDRKLMTKVGGKQKLIVWHISRVARYLREKHNTRVLAWHDMFANIGEADLKHYRMTELVEPVIWNYAEDLNRYLPSSTWQRLTTQFGCRMQPSQSNLRGCRFPGAKIYELVQQLKTLKDSIESQLYSQYTFQGWLSKTAQRFNVSSVWYLNQLMPKINVYVGQFEAIKSGLKTEMDTYFYKDTRNEFIFQYLEQDYRQLKTAKDAGDAIIKRQSFPLRPFPELLSDD